MSRSGSNHPFQRASGTLSSGAAWGKPTPRGLLNDFTRGLGQQMFFWGRDVVAERNLLLCHGFEKRRSSGLQGTSCYRKRWNGGWIELHGACAGWYPIAEGTTGFLYIRADQHCYVHAERTPVIPGRYDYSRLDSRDVDRLLPAARCFATWLIEYESWIGDHLAPTHRANCFRMLSRLPSARPWLAPSSAKRWFAAFAVGDSSLTRSRLWK